MIRLLAAIRKEMLLLSRDMHGLAVLYIMPLLFILIMSLTLEDAFDSNAGRKITISILDFDQTEASEFFIENLAEGEAFSAIVRRPEDVGTINADLRSALDQDDAMFALAVPRTFGETLLDESDLAAGLHLLVAADADRRTEMIFMSALKQGLGRQKVDTLLRELAEDEDEDLAQSSLFETPLTVTYADGDGDETRPSAVQQNVPAWLVFAIFFVAIPFSNTFITERELGVQDRLRTTELSAAIEFAGKLIPYFIINLTQVALMLIVGRWVVPLLGGNALAFGNSPLGLLAIASGVSFAALTMALLIAVIARTTEQATLVSGTGNILLAAIGGIMVPRFMMPDPMQALAAFSPMAWGLDGFLEILLHDGRLSDIGPSMGRLVLFGSAMLIIASVLHSRRKRI